MLPLILIIVTVLLGLSLFFRVANIQKHAYQLASESARNIFRMIVLTRQWNAEHNGIYVFASDKNPSNPYLELAQRDIPLSDGRKLTMINPAYMTRQIAELAESDPQLHIRLHITSLKPIRPDNKPDDWEAHALQEFEQGQQEITSIEHQTNGNQLRYMAPLMVKPACLSCHAKQGYKEGDVRGGISVSLPMTAVEAAMQDEILASWISHGVSYSLLILISWGLLELLARRWRTLDETIEVLQETRKELVENEKMASLGRLVAGFAHELNTPVGVAVGAVSHADDTLEKLTELLTQDEVSELVLNQQISYLRESHHLALSNLRRAADLVHRFKRTSIDRSTQQKRMYRLHEVIDDVLTTLRNILKRTSIAIDVDCSDDLELCGTPGLLEQVLTNLITNSVAHGFENGTRPGQIRIKAVVSKARHLIIDYQDNGIGMTEEVRQKAFEPFFTTYREHGGSGLGLYVTYNIITQQMDGTVHLVSAPQEGTHFHIDCPIDSTPLPDKTL
ncbi:hypothetical protein A1342_07065 [Methylomonas methanica]|uniref:histidine kinase n=1 Tax=Methylomonas denitrificans TaxID=1538553 RepID=A0A140E6H8_9GAMM|nr:hypothetical protein JT25_021370 [Methylomonas denitrificans]OAH96944.1 hypothetical protein A1342_07065 [Methylomonas methanica]